MVSFLPSKECIDKNVFFPVQIKISRNELRGYRAMSSTSSLVFWSARCMQESRNGMDASYLCSFVLNRCEKRIDLSTG